MKRKNPFGDEDTELRYALWIVQVIVFTLALGLLIVSAP